MDKIRNNKSVLVIPDRKENNQDNLKGKMELGKRQILKKMFAKKNVWKGKRKE